jgi:hypothetical protein
MCHTQFWFKATEKILSFYFCLFCFGLVLAILEFKLRLLSCEAGVLLLESHLQPALLWFEDTVL